MVKPLLVLDFDNVLHLPVNSYERADVISGGPLPGAVAFCQRALEEFEVLIVSARCSQPGGAEAIMNWLGMHEFPEGIGVSYTGCKPAALVTLDDRALTFTGEWPEVGELLAFKPWNKG